VTKAVQEKNSFPSYGECFIFEPFYKLRNINKLPDINIEIDQLGITIIKINKDLSFYLCLLKSTDDPSRLLSPKLAGKKKSKK
jgi:hypothetical protein